MLDLMRKHARSWIIKVALGGIIIVFVFWYGWSGPGDQTRNYAAEVNGTIISPALFQTVYESELAKMRLRFQGSLPAELIEKLNLKQKVLEGMVDQLLLMQEAERLGMFVTDQDLVRNIQSNPVFQSNGAFDSRMYAAYLQSIKLTPSLYEDSERRRILAGHLVRLLTDGVETDLEEIKRLWHFQNDRLVLSMLLVKPEEEPIQPSVEALESYYEKNRSKYELPATLNLNYVVISWRDVAKDVKVPEEDVRAYYETHPEEFVVPQRVKVSHILLRVPEDADDEKKESVRKKAEALHAGIKGGEQFEAVAAAESQDEESAKKGGYLGFFSKGTMDPKLEEVAFNMEVGQVSEPLLSEEGYHLIRVDEIAPEKKVEFDLAKDKIVAKLSEQTARNRVTRVAQDFYEQVYRTENLDEQAGKFGLAVRKGEFITRHGGIPDVGADPAVMDEAFVLKAGEISRLVKTGDDYVVMRLEERTDERIPTLDEIRSSVEKDYVKQVAMDNAEKKAGEIIKALLKESSDPQKVAEEFGLAWKDLDPVSRTTGLVPELGRTPAVSELLTTVSPSNPLFAEPLPVAGGAAVVRLVRIEPASDVQYEKEALTFKNWVLEVRKTDFLKGWVQKLRDKSDITLNDRLL
ncbi:MAG: SurA N-terminal domain-containing protein [Desulfomonilaceae bacterium]|nr:SurA N-terminal domain-containing protein [Desulfomonilaceae bacterium]